MEKYLLRISFDICYPDLLPNIILFRTKEAFSDGISELNDSWYMMVKNYFDNKVSDEEYNEYSYKDKFIKTKEAYYYWKHHNDNFNGNFNTIPYYWLPNWSNNNNEPSARVLTVYNN